MNEHVDDEKYALKYLLGELPEAQQARMEERSFHDSGLSELLSEAEDDLIDRYVRQSLSGSERKRFENHFLVSERRREKVGFARALRLSEQTRTSLHGVTPQKAFSWTIVPPLRSPHRALSYGFATLALFALLGGLWLLTEVRQIRREVADTNAERAQREKKIEEMRKQADEQRLRGDELAGQKQELEQQVARLRRQSEIPDTRAGERQLAQTVMAFILSPGARGSDAIKSLTVSPGIQTVRMRLALNPGDEYPVYQVRLQTAAGHLIRTWNGLKASAAQGKQVVFINVPVKLLDASRYEVTLTGNGKGRSEDLGYYYFSILKN